MGGVRLLEFMDEFGLQSVVPLADEVIARSERAMREAIARVPDGVYRNELTMDGYDQPVTLRVAVAVRGDEMHVDYAGSSPASTYGINVVLNYTEAYTTFGLKCALAPEVPNNEGSFRPVTITAPPGCILNCLPPSPVAARHIVGQWLPNAVHGALFHAVPERVLAEGASGLWNTQFNGQRADGRRFSLLFFNSGGMGARATKDGLSSTAFPSGVQGTPAEIVEARAPLMVVKRELRPDSGGPGATRGGLGHWMVLKGLGSEAPARAKAGRQGVGRRTGWAGRSASRPSSTARSTPPGATPGAGRGRRGSTTWTAGAGRGPRRRGPAPTPSRRCGWSRGRRS